MNDQTLQARMREATRLTLAGQLGQATSMIQEALNRSSQSEASDVLASLRRPFTGTTPLVLDGLVVEVPDHPLPARTRPEPSDAAAFIAGTHTHASLTRQYKLYVPPNHADKPLPLVVMLHGCTQNPDDFAAGTAMNEHAAEQGFFVLYPAQAQDANPSRCWNWFKHNHQQRGRGEPGLIADLVQTLVKQYAMDASRVYIAGLSAGGAMAAIVAQAYPDVFAAVGVHSGLPQGSANNVAEALAVMKSGASARGLQPAHPHVPVPAIVFHGDQDQTVHPRNGEQVIADVVGQMATAGANDRCPQLDRGVVPGGRRYTRTVHQGHDGRVIAEHWVVHGAGHAWSGGRATGSYTDASGPDATGEMLRFFLAHSLDAG